MSANAVLGFLWSGGTWTVPASMLMGLVGTLTVT